MSTSLKKQKASNVVHIPRDCILRRWWGYFTYSLLHVDFGHLFFNLLLQCGVGLGLEMVHGTISVMILFILGVGGKVSFDHCLCLRCFLDRFHSFALIAGPCMVLAEVRQLYPNLKVKI